MIRSLLIAGLVALASPVLALSCMPPDPARDFERAAKDDKPWVIVHGTVTFDEKKLPNRSGTLNNDAPPRTEIPAYFKGRSLTKNGFLNRFETPVTLTAVCLGPWCGGASSGTEYLAFLLKDGDSYTMSVSPCGGNSYAKPGQDVLDRMTRCMNGDCPPSKGPVKMPKKR